MTKHYAKEFEAKGYRLESFTRSDARRIGPNGEMYKYYASKNGTIIKRFELRCDAVQWIEFK